MGQFKTSLKPDDLKLFYDVLYQNEKEGRVIIRVISIRKCHLRLKTKFL
ncbi:hypothetical protein PREVCOP_06280 [Segatella copri DSM 18205]|uniref:Uncharacterized protein n=1 Tax=Segatella copri DSM 18205 TaxID=537011 RepID=D1PGB6_9BACT|nr:hypothetical protein PREVCOP_06280 [Segatella copri DSM 18205]